MSAKGAHGRKPGRPSEFTAEVEKAILDALAAGASVTDSVEAAGISERTYRRWLEEGEPDDGPKHFRRFRESVVQARARGRVAHAAIIRRAANEGDWRASAWFLERSDPQNWSLKYKLEHSGPDGGPLETEADRSSSGIRINPAKLSREQIENYYEIMAAGGDEATQRRAQGVVEHIKERRETKARFAAARERYDARMRGEGKGQAGG